MGSHPPGEHQETGLITQTNQKVPDAWEGSGVGLPAEVLEEASSIMFLMGHSNTCLVTCGPCQAGVLGLPGGKTD